VDGTTPAACCEAVTAAAAKCDTLTAASTPALSAVCTGGRYTGNLIAGASCTGAACVATDAAACCVAAASAACTRPVASTGYNAPTADPTMMGDSTDAGWPVTAGSDSFASACATGYSGTVVAAACASAGAYTLSGCYLYDDVCVTKENYVGNTSITIPYGSGYNGKCDVFFGGVPEFNGVDWTSSSCDRFNTVQKDILEKAGECCGGKPVACVSNTPATDYS
jgi:hypothetical protein